MREMKNSDGVVGRPQRRTDSGSVGGVSSPNEG